MAFEFLKKEDGSWNVGLITLSVLLTLLAVVGGGFLVYFIMNKGGGSSGGQPDIDRQGQIDYDNLPVVG